MSVGELERVYGRDAQVELRSSPVQQYAPPVQQYQGSDNGYYEQYADEDPVEVPVRRSPWLPIVVVLMLGVGAVLGYGLFRRGLVPEQLAPAPAPMQETESLPVERSFTALPALPRITTEGVARSVSGATPAEPLPAPEQQPGSEALAAPATPQPAPAQNRAAAGARSASEDEAATLEMIRRERERAANPEAPETDTTPPEYRSEPSEPAPIPGYIEAEVR
jgi:hypothetical protein